VGSGRYFGRCERRRYPNADAHCHGDGNGHRDPDRDCNSITDSHAASDPITQRWAISEAAPHASAEAIRIFVLEIPRRRTPV
jgi:hypothetical protein